MFKHEPWAIKVLGEKLSSFHKETIHEHTNAEAVTKYWSDKNDISKEVWQDIEWRASKVALKERPMGKRRWFAKNATSHCATGRMMLRRKEWTNSRCPRCGTVDECTKHLCRCQDPEARKQWQASLKSLEKWMDSVDTDPLITKHVLALLQSWVRDDPAPPNPRGMPRLKKALIAQSAIGGWNTLLGRVSIQLRDRMELRYKSKQSRRSGFRWTVALVKKLQDIAWDMWEHRNGILHDNPDKHHRKAALEQADADIEQEWTRGNQGLLKEDLFLFRFKPALMKRTLERKWVWLESVAGARAAAAADAASRHSFQQERTRMRDWLEGKKRAGTTNKQQKRQKKRQKKNA
jgi:hypothetical protein